MPVKNEVCDTRTWLEHNKGFVTADSCTKLSSATKAARYLRFDQRRAARHQNGWSDDQQYLLMGKLAEVDTKPQLEIYAMM